MLWLAVVVLVWLLYRLYTANYETWKKRGIAYTPAVFPFGSKRQLPLFTGYPGYVIDEMYREHKTQPYFGYFHMRTPILVMRDPEMVRLVLAKEFSHFRDRMGFDPPKDDPLSNHLFTLEGERWRALRVKLSPTFSTGKLKAMFPLFVDCTQVLDRYLERVADGEVDLKDVTGRFNTDIICSCAFGLGVNSLEDESNPFRRLAQTLGTVSLRGKLRSAMVKTHPGAASVFKVTTKRVWDFLYGVIRATVEERERKGVSRNDFLDLLIQLKNNKESLIDDSAELIDGKKPEPVEMTLELMTAQCFVFFFAGFETSSTVQSYCLYELAKHPEIQDRLREELRQVLDKHGGKLTYQAVQEMEYLEMVVSETMRKYPTLNQLNRRCTKAFTTPWGQRIEKGDSVLIPIWSLHHDEQYFPKPDQFDPERFSKERVGSIRPYVYLPFGEGPRICIGMRFGQLQTKTGLITLLRKFSVEPCSKTPERVTHAAHSLLSVPSQPILLKVVRRGDPF